MKAGSMNQTLLGDPPDAHDVWMVPGSPVALCHRSHGQSATRANPSGNRVRGKSIRALHGPPIGVPNTVSQLTMASSGARPLGGCEANASMRSLPHADLTERPISRCLAAPLVAFALMTGVAPAVGPPDPPELTKEETKGIELKHGTYNLGSIGLRGWIYHQPASNLDMRQGRTTIASRQILVTHVGAKSPADGRIEVNDVILGVGGKRFTDDARKSIAGAIQDAEKEANGGILKLIRWRAGQTEEVELKCRIMGTYSDTAPYDCPKSQRVFEAAIKAIEAATTQPELRRIAR